MGNQVVVEKDPPPIDYLLGKQIKKDTPKEGVPDPGYNSVLYFWQFEREKDKNAASKPFVCTPVPMLEKAKFDKKSAYLVLHIYRLHGKPASNDSSHGLPPITELADHIVKCVTPRGASAPLGKCPFISMNDMAPNPEEASQLYHDTYVWSGKDASPLASAQARAKGLNIDRRLVRRYPQLLRALFYREGKAPINSIFSTAVELDEDYQGLLIAENRLISQLLYQAVSGNVQFLPLYAGAPEDIRAYGELQQKMLRSNTAAQLSNAIGADSTSIDEALHAAQIAAAAASAATAASSASAANSATVSTANSSLLQASSHHHHHHHHKRSSPRSDGEKVDKPEKHEKHEKSSASVTGLSLELPAKKGDILHNARRAAPMTLPLNIVTKSPPTAPSEPEAAPKPAPLSARPSLKGFSLNTARAQQVQDDMLRKQEEDDRARAEALRRPPVDIAKPAAPAASSGNNGHSTHPSHSIPYSTSAPSGLHMPLPQLGNNTLPPQNQALLNVVAPTTARTSLIGTLPNPSDEDFRILDAPPPLPGEPEAHDWKALQAFYMAICSRITRFLYLGSRQVASDLALLKANGITHVLNCAGAAAEVFFPNDFQYRVLWLLDGQREDVSSLFYDVIEWIDQARLAKGRVYIHCEKGISRSSTMAIAYLMYKLDCDFRPTAEAVKRIRKIASPNTSFIVQLGSWHQRRKTAVTTARVFLVTPHSPEDPSYVARVQTGDPRLPQFYYDMLKNDLVHLVETATVFYICAGEAAPAVAVEAAHKLVKQIQKYEKAPADVKVIRPCDRTAAELGLRERVVPDSTLSKSQPVNRNNEIQK